jgi:hypothetical protein
MRNRNWLNRAERDGPVLWSCLACGGQPPGQFLDDPEGRAAHHRAAGHPPVAGRPLGPLMGLQR